MKVRETVLLLGLLAGMSVFVPYLTAQEGSDADAKAIEEIWSAYETSRVAADAETWLTLWDEGALKMSEGRPTQSFADLQAGAPKAFVPGSLAAMEINAEEIVVLGDWAFSSGNFSVDPVKDGKTAHLEGKFLTVFKRQEDGSWRIYRDSASMNQ